MDDSQLAFLKERYDYLLDLKWELERQIESLIETYHNAGANLRLYLLIHCMLLEVDAKRTNIANSKGIIALNPSLPPRPQVKIIYAKRQRVFHIRISQFMMGAAGLQKIEYLHEEELKEKLRKSIDKGLLIRKENDTEICYYSKLAYKLKQELQAKKELNIL